MIVRVLGEGQPEGSGHPRAFRRRPPGGCRGLRLPPRPRSVVGLAEEGTRPTRGAGGFALGAGVAVGGIPAVRALRGGGMARRGDGPGWQTGHRLLGDWWCGVAVLGQTR
jgi:hypothetical protein